MATLDEHWNAAARMVIDEVLTHDRELAQRLLDEVNGMRMAALEEQGAAEVQAIKDSFARAKRAVWGGQGD